MRYSLSLAELEGALASGTEPNDLLPARAGDKLGAQLGKRFMASLHGMLESDSYYPVRSIAISVPKSSLNTRPASLLTLQDRIIFSALVSRLRPRIDSALMPNEVVFFPRGMTAEKKWRDFELAPLKTKLPYIVVADIAGFYESIDHELLKAELLKASGQSTEVEELINFLGTIMGSRRGLPQGYEPSDALATIYLGSIDSEMVRLGLDYFRHGDDMRIAVASFQDGRGVLSALEAALREMRLLPNTLKCKILLLETYSAQLNLLLTVKSKYSAKIQDKLAQNILEQADYDLLEQIIGEDRLWEWYHADTSDGERVLEIAGKITPPILDVAKEMFDDVMRRSPDKPSGMSPEEFHQILQKVMTIFTAGKSSFAVKDTTKLILEYPDKTRMLTNYLKSIFSGNSAEVLRVVENVLSADGFKTGWETSLVIEVINAGGVSNEQINKLLLNIAKNEDMEWIARVEASTALAKVGELTQDHAHRLWRLAPLVYRGEVVKAVKLMVLTEAWAKNFLSTINDPAYVAVKNS